MLKVETVIWCRRRDCAAVQKVKTWIATDDWCKVYKAYKVYKARLVQGIRQKIF